MSDRITDKDITNAAERYTQRAGLPDGWSVKPYSAYGRTALHLHSPHHSGSWDIIGLTTKRDLHSAILNDQGHNTAQRNAWRDELTHVLQHAAEGKQPRRVTIRSGEYIALTMTLEYKPHQHTGKPSAHIVKAKAVRTVQKFKWTCEMEEPSEWDIVNIITN